MQTDASVGRVIVTYNNAQMLESILQDLYAQTVKPAEIFVIVNSSDDQSARMVKGKFPQVRYVKSATNIGSAGGYYEGIKLAVQSNELVWLLDDDSYFPRDSLQQLLEGFQSLGEQKNVGALRSWRDTNCPFSKPQKVDTFAWRATLITKEAVKKIGLPKSEYFLYADDAEYAKRMVKNGFSIFWIPKSIVSERREDDRKRLRLFGLYARVYEDKAKLYYAFRNQTHLYLSYGQAHKLFTTLLYSLKVILLIYLVQKKNRREKIIAIFDGLWDGFRARLGRNQHYAF